MSGKTVEKNALKISILLKMIFSEEKLSQMKLCIVPSETVSQTIIRYKYFCERLSVETGLINGYCDIQNSAEQKGSYDRTKI